MNDTTNRIESIIESHPWMLRDEARLLLVAHYHAATRVMGLSGSELNDEMERGVDFFKRLERKTLMQGIQIASRASE